MRKTVTSLLVLICSMGLLQAQEWYVYDGSAIPTDLDGWTASSDNSGPNMVEIVLDDPDIEGNKIFQYIQPDGLLADGSKASKYNRLKFVDDNVVSDFTMLTRMKGISIDSLDGELINQLDYQSYFREVVKLNPDDSLIQFDYSEVEVNVAVNMIDWHIYRFVYSQEGAGATEATVSLYLDEADVPVLTGTSVKATTNHFFRFGDAGSARISGYTDWLVIDTTGAYAPGTGAPIPEGLSLDFGPGEVAPLLPDPLAHWKLDEASGDVILEEISGADGGIVGAGLARVDGVDGMALEFASAADTAIVIVEDSEATSGINFTSESFTLSLFARIDPFIGATTLFMKGDNGTDGPNGNGNRYALLSKEGEIRFTIDDDVTKTQLGVESAMYPSNQWAHIVGVRNVEKDSIYLYLNGTEIGRMLDETGALDVENQRIVIGNYHTLDKKINGALDDIRVFNKALTADEINQMANNYLIFVSGITVTADSSSIGIGTTLQMEAAVAPLDATNNTVLWSVNDPAVATINATSGLLTAVSEGTVTVTATAGDGSGVTGTLEITVEGSPEPPDASLSSLIIDVGTLSPEFDAATYVYTADVPAGTVAVTVTATPTDAGAGVAGAGTVDVSSGTGKSTVVVTAVDGETTEIYTIDFTVLVGLDQTDFEEVNFYYNSLGDHLAIANASGVERVEIYSLTGSLLSTVRLNRQESVEINTGELSDGLYVIRMKFYEQGLQTGKFVKF